MPMTGHGRCAPRVRREKTERLPAEAHRSRFTPYAQGKTRQARRRARQGEVHPVCAGDPPRKAPPHSLGCCSPRMRRGKQPGSVRPHTLCSRRPCRPVPEDIPALNSRCACRRKAAFFPGTGKRRRFFRRKTAVAALMLPPRRNHKKSGPKAALGIICRV